MPRLFLFFLLSLSGISAFSKEPPRVVVTIKPVHSLVSAIMQGVGKPELIIKGSYSPHRYNLKPSTRRLFSTAHLIVWVSPAIESFMPRIISTLKTHQQQLMISSNKELTLLHIRQLPAQEESHLLNKNMHVWLSPENAKIISKDIYLKLKNIDPENQETYKKNMEQLLNKIDLMDSSLKSKLQGIDQPFMTYHDAYQYFENTYFLNNVAILSVNAEISPSIKYIQEAQNRVEFWKIPCIFYDFPKKPPLIDTIIKNKKIKTQPLDAIGYELEAGPEAWFQLMNNLGNNYYKCLKPAG